MRNMVNIAHVHRRVTCRHSGRSEARRIDDEPSLRQHEEVCSYPGFERGYRHVDQEEARHIDGSHSLMQGAEVNTFECRLH